MIDRAKCQSSCNDNRLGDNCRNTDSVCINTRKIYDSCKSKECLSNLKVYPTRCSQAIIDRATGVKPKSAKLLWVYIDVEEINFNNGYYTVDAQYFYRVTCDAYCGVASSQEITGLCTFNKRCILFGSEGSAKIFSSTYIPGDRDDITTLKSNLPIAVVETVDPICLDAKFRRELDFCPCAFPGSICSCFDDELIIGECEKALYVTLGQFSIIRLERDIQLTLPNSDICVPTRECCCDSPDTTDPCEIFDRFSFPVDQFFPPKATSDNLYCTAMPRDESRPRCNCG